MFKKNIEIGFLVYALPYVEDFELSKSILNKIFSFYESNASSDDKVLLGNVFDNMKKSIEKMNGRNKDLIKSVIIRSYYNITSGKAELTWIDEYYSKTNDEDFKEFVESLGKQKGFDEVEFLAGYIGEIIGRVTSKGLMDMGSFLSSKGAQALSFTEKCLIAELLDSYIEDVYNYFDREEEIILNSSCDSDTDSKQETDYVKFLREALQFIPIDILKIDFGKNREYPFLSALSKELKPKFPELVEYKRPLDERRRMFEENFKQDGHAFDRKHDRELEKHVKHRDSILESHNERYKADDLLTRSIIEELPIISMLVATTFFDDKMSLLYKFSAIALLGGAAGVSEFQPYRYGVSVLALGAVAKNFNLPNRVSVVAAVFTLPLVLMGISSFVREKNHKKYLQTYNNMKEDEEQKMEKLIDDLDREEEKYLAKYKDMDALLKDWLENSKKDFTNALKNVARKHSEVNELR